MMKTDPSVRKICIAAIKRKTKAPFDFLATRFFENELIDCIGSDMLILFDVAGNELPIAMTYLDENNFTVVTTRQIISRQNGLIQTCKAEEVKYHGGGDFKGYGESAFTLEKHELFDGRFVDVFIETGRASMVMIYAIMTLVNLRR